MKTCFKCKEEKPLSEFYEHPMMGDGHLGKCKECTRSDVREHRIDNADRIREYDRVRSKGDEAKARAADYGRRHQQEHPERNAARLAASRAVARGDIQKRPCHFCGSEVDIEMHHPDYAHPLKVYWLCRICHRKLDGMMKLAPAEN